MEYIFRDNDENLFLPNFEGKMLSDTLKKDYNYIYESMKANRYDINIESYNLLCELVCDNKVVGFAAYYMPQASAMSLTHSYVLPEFESENLLCSNFLVLMSSGANVSILNPTRDIVESLVENNYATKLTDSIVSSAISFDMLNNRILGNYNLNGITPSTNLYDLNLCSPIFLYDISTPGVCEIFYLDVSPFDDKKYNCSEFRNSINIDEYFNDIKKVFLKNSEEFNQALFNLKSALPTSFLDYDEIIGEGEELSDYFEGVIEEGMLDKKTAIKIRDQLKKEYENGEVTDQGLALRVIYLIGEDEHMVDIETYDDVAVQFDNYCPYCHSHVSTSALYCQTCGYAVSNTGTVGIRDIKK